MNDLIKKYRTDSLTSRELEESRDRAAAMTDSELSNAMRDDWDEMEPDGVLIPDGAKELIKHRIDAGLGLNRRTWGVRIWQAVRVASVILLPLFVVATVWLYTHGGSVTDDMISVSTFARQRSEVILPDSSVVTLNGASTLNYSQNAFHGDARNVVFRGEGFFNIAKDSSHPFVVSAHGLTVTVKGTRFNLSARDDAKSAHLYLEEGLVEMTSELTGEVVEVRPGESATLSYADGHIVLSAGASGDNIMAWMNGGLAFNDSELADVLDAMCAHYGCTVEVNDESALGSRFTGTIPADDLNLAVAILEKIFNIGITATPTAD